jgi:hypothetical protein
VSDPDIRIECRWTTMIGDDNRFVYEIRGERPDLDTHCFCALTQDEYLQGGPHLIGVVIARTAQMLLQTEPIAP